MSSGENRPDLLAGGCLVNAAIGTFAWSSGAIETLVRTGVGVYEITTAPLSILEHIPKTQTILASANACVVNIERVSDTLWRIRTSSSNVAFDIDFLLMFERLQNRRAANVFTPSPLPPPPGGAGVATWTAGAGLINSGTAVNPIGDVVAANTSIQVNADDIQLGAVIPTAHQFTFVGTAIDVLNDVRIRGTLTLDTDTINVSATQAASAGVNVTSVAWAGGAHTALPAATENIDLNFNGARTVQWAAGAFALQRFYVFQGPTLGFVGATTVTATDTVAITSAPIAGANATLTRSHHLRLMGSGVMGFGNPNNTASLTHTVFFYNGTGAGAILGQVDHTVSAGLGYLTFNSARVVSVGSFANSTVMGLSATDTGDNATVVGRVATAAAGGTAVGAITGATGAGSVAIGSSAAGAGAQAAGASSIAIGNASGTNAADTNSIALGVSMVSTAADQFIGRGTTVIFGRGDTQVAPPAVTLRITNVSGPANTNGATLSIGSGNSSGTGTGGNIDFLISPAGAGGAGLNAGVMRMRITSTGALTNQGANAGLNFTGVTSTPEISTNTADFTIILTGNRNAASGNQDVQLRSSATRTAGSIAAVRNNATNVTLFAFHGGITVSQAVVAAGTNQMLVLTGAAHTAQTASTEISFTDFNQGSVQWATGNFAVERAYRFRAPTIAFVAASTLDDSATLSVDAAPIAGANATLTRTYSIWSQGGTFRHDGALRFNNEITPAQLTANQNDYAPANFATAFNLRQGVDATGRTITGMAGGTAGRYFLMTNIETVATNIITITNEDAASAAANRFLTANGANMLIRPGGSLEWCYDGTSSRWRPVSQI